MNKSLVEERMLPAEILFETLTYLKLKELLKASEVSKSWYYLIHNYEDGLKKEQVKKYIKNLLVQHVKGYEGTMKDASMDSFISIARKLNQKSKVTNRIVAKTSATLQNQFSPSNLIELFRLSLVALWEDFQNKYRPVLGQMDFKKIILMIMVMCYFAANISYFIKLSLGREANYLGELAKSPSYFITSQTKVMGYALLLALGYHFFSKLYANIKQAHANYEQNLIAIVQENPPELNLPAIKISPPAEFKTICWDGSKFFKEMEKNSNVEKSTVEEQQLKKNL